MNNLFLVTVIQAVYVVYMLRYFKTRYSLAHPLVNFKSEWLHHPVGVSREPIVNICPFGQQGGLLIAGLLFVRLYIAQQGKVSSKVLKMYSRMGTFLIFLFSLLNMNAVVYLIPFFISEYYVQKLL